MKLRVYKSQLYKALLWYTDQLTKAHMNQWLTPAKVEQISRDLYALQDRKQKTESNSVWKVPVALHVDNQRNLFEVVVADESNVLYLDME